MRCLCDSRGWVLSTTIALMAACSLAGCSSGTKAEAGGVGTSGDASGIGVSFAQTYLTIENHTGAPIVDGEVAIVPGGVMRPYRTALRRIESSPNCLTPLPMSQMK